MSDNHAAIVHEILVDELAIVSDEMIEAASRELTRISVAQVPDPHRPGRMVTMPAQITEAQQFTAIWQAMLRAKLGAAR